jgi:Uma2 family endonuclease
MMAEPVAAPLMTADDLLRLSENVDQYELVRGRLVRVSPASSRASLVALRIAIRLGAYVEAQGLGVCGGADWGMRLRTDPDTVRAPDVGFVRAECIPAARKATVFQPGAVPATAGEAGVLSGAEVVPGFTLRLSEVWV